MASVNNVDRGIWAPVMITVFLQVSVYNRIRKLRSEARVERRTRGPRGESSRPTPSKTWYRSHAGR